MLRLGRSINLFGGKMNSLIEIPIQWTCYMLYLVAAQMSLVTRTKKEFWWGQLVVCLCLWGILAGIFVVLLVGSMLNILDQLLLHFLGSTAILIVLALVWKAWEEKRPESTAINKIKDAITIVNIAIIAMLTVVIFGFHTSVWIATTLIVGAAVVLVAYLLTRLL